MYRCTARSLWVYTYNDFTDPIVPDYDVHNWFRP